MLQSKRNADERDAKQYSANKMGECDPQSCEDQPNQIQQTGKPRDGSSCRTNPFSKRGKRRNPNFKSLQSPGNTHNGATKN